MKTMSLMLWLIAIGLLSGCHTFSDGLGSMSRKKNQQIANGPSWNADNMVAAEYPDFPGIPEARPQGSVRGGTNELLQTAHEAAANGRLQEARQAYLEVLDQDAKNALAHHRLAVIADNLQDFTDAERHYRMALALAPREPQLQAELYSDLGYSYLLQARFDESESNLKRSLEFNPTYAKALNNLGLLYAKSGDYEAALSHFRQSGADEQEIMANMREMFPNGPNTAATNQTVPAGTNTIGPQTEPTLPNGNWPRSNQANIGSRRELGSSANAQITSLDELLPAYGTESASGINRGPVQASYDSNQPTTGLNAPMPRMQTADPAMIQADGRPRNAASPSINPLASVSHSASAREAMPTGNPYAAQASGQFPMHSGQPNQTHPTTAFPGSEVQPGSTASRVPDWPAGYQPVSPATGQQAWPHVNSHQINTAQAGFQQPSRSSIQQVSGDFPTGQQNGNVTFPAQQSAGGQNAAIFAGMNAGGIMPLRAGSRTNTGRIAGTNVQQAGIDSRLGSGFPQTDRTRGNGQIASPTNGSPVNANFQNPSYQGASSVPANYGTGNSANIPSMNSMVSFEQEIQQHNNGFNQSLREISDARGPIHQPNRVPSPQYAVPSARYEPGPNYQPGTGPNFAPANSGSSTPSRLPGNYR